MHIDWNALTTASLLFAAGICWCITLWHLMTIHMELKDEILMASHEASAAQLHVKTNISKLNEFEEIVAAHVEEIRSLNAKLNEAYDQLDDITAKYIKSEEHVERLKHLWFLSKKVIQKYAHDLPTDWIPGFMVRFRQEYVKSPAPTA